MVKKNEKYPEGHFVGMYMGIFIAIFAGFGIVLSLTTDNPGLIGIGPALGVAIGVAVGQAMEDKYKKEGKIRPLTPKEKKRKEKSVAISLLVGAALLVLALFYFFSG